LHLLILGASVRAAAYSALRAGFEPLCGDLFADRDLRSIAPGVRIATRDYPMGLAELARSAPAAPWIYTGALENQPELVSRISLDRPLWGNPESTLRAVRDPRAVAAVLRESGFPCPMVRLDPAGLARDGSWLVKPIASAGGEGVGELIDEESDARESRCYYQERIEGLGLAAVFVSAGGGTDTRLMGVTRQTIGHGAGPFVYTGSIGPWPLERDVAARIEAIGRELAMAFRLVGLFGVDLILRDGEPWPVEVNPRYTASVEVLELSLGRALLAAHARACDPSVEVVEERVPVSPRRRWVGKSIVFAAESCRFPDRINRSTGPIEPFAIPRVADIPDVGSAFEPGQPVLTVLAHGTTAAACGARLARQRAGWLRRLRREWPGGAPPCLQALEICD
jgi:predicted ATP-grasp superfamily ATP-dependent carboligase